MAENPIRILLVDDHSLFREGLARLLGSEPGLAVIGHCASIDDALSLVGSQPLDVVLLDYDLGIELGTEFLRAITVLQNPPRILLVTAGMPEKAIRDALAAGAVNIVLKHSGPRHLIDSIRKAVTQDIHAEHETILQALDRQTDVPYPGALGDRPLTKRQSTALQGILNGLSNKEIANLMTISEGSVKAILQELFHKAGVRTRSQLVRVAIERHSADWIK